MLGDFGEIVEGVEGVAACLEDGVAGGGGVGIGRADDAVGGGGCLHISRIARTGMSGVQMMPGQGCPRYRC